MIYKPLVTDKSVSSQLTGMKASEREREKGAIRSPNSLRPTRASEIKQFARQNFPLYTHSKRQRKVAQTYIN